MIWSQPSHPPELLLPPLLPVPYPLWLCSLLSTGTKLVCVFYKPIKWSNGLSVDDFEQMFPHVQGKGNFRSLLLFLCVFSGTTSNDCTHSLASTYLKFTSSIRPHTGIRHSARDWEEKGKQTLSLLCVAPGLLCRQTTKPSITSGG